MSVPTLPKSLLRTADFIERAQLANGAIPWFEGSIIDPWDHVEAAMGLSTAGRHAAARKAFAWLGDRQRDNGAWYAAYDNDSVADDTRAETNFVAYAATGVWHHYLATDDTPWLSAQWPMVKAACEFVLQHQAPTGEVYWAVDKTKGVSHDALVTGCSSIYRSLLCATHIAQTLREPYRHLQDAADQIAHALRYKPERFDRTWPSKARYSMDWFYPVLTGVYQGDHAVQRLDSRWSEFVEPQLGCRCVAEEPWVTMAETCELVMACIA